MKNFNQGYNYGVLIKGDKKSIFTSQSKRIACKYAYKRYWDMLECFNIVDDDGNIIDCKELFDEFIEYGC